ncbi:MAG: sulfoxide reductase heme-binding subunit YedZ [Chloroflexi bacterium]|nr:sulfoxide reductase heme-binding subunit YedZ [Chloroflexota bacterium]
MRCPKALTHRIVFHVAALLPLLWLLWDLSQNQLTANPIREIQLRTGRYALTLLALSLACTPAYRISGLRQFLDARRPLGLYAFAYASLHFLNFMAVDYRFDFSLIREDLLEKRYAVAGFATYLILLALAVTSTRGWRERLGKKWKRLHRLVYVAAILGVVHFLWQVKADATIPVIYAIAVVLLLAFRLPHLQKALRKNNSKIKRQRSKPQLKT